MGSFEGNDKGDIDQIEYIMSTYHNDDDMIDYQDQLPDFDDEADFEDYLNDEEYDLVNEMFPLAKKEMADFLGWSNLNIKVALLENDFNLNEALYQLQKTFKKKKQTPATKGMFILFYFYCLECDFSFFNIHIAYYCLPFHIFTKFPNEWCFSYMRFYRKCVGFINNHRANQKRINMENEKSGSL